MDFLVVLYILISVVSFCPFWSRLWSYPRIMANFQFLPVFMSHFLFLYLFELILYE